MFMLDSEVRKFLERLLPGMFQKKELDSLTSGLLTVNNIKQILFKHPCMRPFPQHRLGGKILVQRDELLEWLEKYNGRITNQDEGRGIREGSGDAGEAGGAGQSPERTRESA